MSLFVIKKRGYILAPIIFLSILSTFHLLYVVDFFYTDTDAVVDKKMPAGLHLKECITKTIETSEKIAPLREGIEELISALYQNGFVTKSEADKHVRPYFVTLQGIIEQKLAFELKRGKIKNVVGIIHTPTPATPLCTEGDITTHLVDPPLIEDEKRLFTVRARADTVRKFLDCGCTLYAVYPEGGLEKRTTEQKLVYLRALQNYPHNLHDHVLSQPYMDHDMVGASYLFEDEEGKECLFSLQAYQANAPADDNRWSMWFGETSQPKIASRLSRVRQFLREAGGPKFQARATPIKLKGLMSAVVN